jgi:geranylgeranyl reductase family protein
MFPCKGWTKGQNWGTTCGLLNISGSTDDAVAVVGAGPAGSAAATALARRGVPVWLLEKATLPRYKTCGGGVLPRAYQMLPARAAEVVERTFHSVLLNFHGEGLHYTATRPEPLVRMTMRAGLDNLLADEAREAGARLLDRCQVRQVTAKHDGVELRTDRGVFQVRFVIAADGVWSPTAKACGWPALRRLAPALEWELYLPAEEFARLGGTARFDFGFIDAGYAWVFPKRRHLSAGILTTGRANLNLAARMEEYLRGLGISRIERSEKHGHVIPLEPRRGPLARGRVLLVGDAAGLADPITAEGISHALSSGRLAAEAILTHQPDAVQVANHYQKLLEQNILAELRAARRLAKFIHQYPRLRHWAFRWQGRRLAHFAAGVVMGERSYREALMDPRNYLKMLGRR